MLAVIKTGGKQYLAKKGDKIKIEKVEGKEGSVIKFTEILFLGNDKEMKVGNPLVKGATVEGKILKQGKSKKVWGIKHKPKKRYKVKFGHRQLVTEVEITKV
jgi:large subunit ribosomal protein L21